MALDHPVIIFDAVMFTVLLLMATVRPQSGVGLMIIATMKTFALLALPLVAGLLYLIVTDDGAGGGWLSTTDWAELGLVCLFAVYLVIVAASGLFALIFGRRQE